MDQIFDQVKARLLDKKYFVARGLQKASEATNLCPLILAQAGGAVIALYLLANSNAFFLANSILTAYPIACTYFFTDERPSRDHLLIYWAALMTLTTFDRILEQIPGYYILKLALLALFFMEPYMLAEKLEQLLNQFAQRMKETIFKDDEQKKMNEVGKQRTSPAPEKPDASKEDKVVRAPSLQLSVNEEPKTARESSVRTAPIVDDMLKTARGTSLRLSLREEPKTAREPSLRAPVVEEMLKTARAPSLRAPVVEDEPKTARAPSLRAPVIEDEPKTARGPSVRLSLHEEPKTAREPSVRASVVDNSMKTAKQASESSLKVMPVEPIEEPKTAREPSMRGAPVVNDEPKTARAPSLRAPVVEDPKTAKEPSVRTAPIVPPVDDNTKTARAPSLRAPVVEEPKTARAPSIRAVIPSQEEQKTARDPSFRHDVTTPSRRSSRRLHEESKKSAKQRKSSTRSEYAMTPQQSYTTARSPATGLTDGRPLFHGANPMLTDSSYKLRSEGKGISNKDIGLAANLNDMYFFPMERIVFNAPFDYDNLTYHMRIQNNARHNIAFAVKGNCIPRISAFPPSGILTPGQKLIVAVTVRKFTYNDIDYNKDRICFEYVLVKDKTVKEFSHKLLEECEIKRRKNIQICYNP